jgi:hypothetical protein
MSSWPFTCNRRAVRAQEQEMMPPQSKRDWCYEAAVKDAADPMEETMTTNEHTEQYIWALIRQDAAAQAALERCTPAEVWHAARLRQTEQDLRQAGQRACRACGINHTARAIRAYLGGGQ